MVDIANSYLHRENWQTPVWEESFEIFAFKLFPNREMYGKGKMWGIVTSSHLKQSVWNLDRLFHNPIAIESAHIIINDYYEY